MTARAPKVNTAKVQRFNELPHAQQAGMLSNDAQFQKFAGTRTIKSGVQLAPSAAAEFIRTYCGVSSRRDLNTDADAAKKFQTLRTEFDAWSGRIPTPR